MGSAFAAVWFSVGLMCSAICWMLQGWLPPGWALLVGALPALRFGVFSYWDDSYSGGALAATAGAVVLGALPRIMRHQRARDALLIAFGLAVLANTRPYEGLLCEERSAMAAYRATPGNAHFAGPYSYRNRHGDLFPARHR